MPSTSDFFSIKVDGSELPDHVRNLLEEAVVEQDLAQPAMFVIRFGDPDMTISDGSFFKLGGEIKITGADMSSKHKPIFAGEITAIEAILAAESKSFVVRGYDLSHRLHRGRKIRTFLKQTDSDIASQVAREAGLSADAQATGERHDFVLQDNLTDMEFLKLRAARVGYRVTVEEKKLKFRQPETSPPDSAKLEWGQHLLSFRMRLTAVAQPNEVQVRGWDYKTKRAIVGRASTAVEPSSPGSAKKAAAAAQEAFGSAQTVHVTKQPIATQGEADKLAQATINDIAGDYLAVEGVCHGEPSIKPGTLVEVAGVGKRLNGKYFVTATRHEYTPQAGYFTTFHVNGHRPTSLLSATDRGSAESTVKGVVVGVVTNITDPEDIGRVKVKYPWLGDQIESDWIRLASPGGGKERGLMLVPEVNDEVLLAFEHGDVNRPFVLSGLWNGKDAAPIKAVEGSLTERRTIKTRIGHNLEFYDKGGQGHIHLKTANGHIVVLNDTDKKLEIKSVKHSILMDDTGQVVKVESAGDLILKAPGGTLKITASGVELVSNSAMKVQSSAMMDVKSSAILNIQGSLVKIN